MIAKKIITVDPETLKAKLECGHFKHLQVMQSGKTRCQLCELIEFDNDENVDEEKSPGFWWQSG